MNEPIACTLTSAEMRSRTEDAARITSAALRSRAPIAGGARLVFDARGSTEHDLRELIAAEAQCCPFLRFELERAGDDLVLDVTGPDDARPIIDELFA
jgi:hypothetical protein